MYKKLDFVLFAHGQKIPRRWYRKFVKGQYGNRYEMIQKAGDDYYACTDEEQRELRDSARPALHSYPDSTEKYDTVFVGSPNRWETKMAMFTQFEKYA